MRRQISPEATARRETRLREKAETDMARFLRQLPTNDSERGRAARLSKQYPEFGEKVKIAWEQLRAGERYATEIAELAELRELHKKHGDDNQKRYEYLKTKYAHRRWGSAPAIDLWGFDTARALYRAIQRRNETKAQIEDGDRRPMTLERLESDEGSVRYCKSLLSKVTGIQSTMEEYRRMIEEEVFPEPTPYNDYWLG